MQKNQTDKLKKNRQKQYYHCLLLFEKKSVALNVLHDDFLTVLRCR